MRHWVIALIMAGGSGKRFACKIPKQYLLYQNIPIITHSIRKFTKHPNVNQVQVVIRPDDIALYSKAVKNENVLSPVYGGAERQDSVRLGLESLTKLNPEIVLIHDACRPFVSPQVISQTIEALKDYDGAIAAAHATDTIKMVNVNSATIDKTVDRRLIYYAQTPQVFKFKEILRLHRLTANESFTDDASIFEKYGKQIKIVHSSKSNIKITTQEDIELYESKAQKTS